MIRTEMNMLTERFAEVTGKMSKATDFINNKCYQLGNPVEPLIFKADALEAISIACKEIEGGKCKHYPHNQKQGSQICDMECDRISYLKKQLACISADK